MRFAIISTFLFSLLTFFGQNQLASQASKLLAAPSMTMKVTVTRVGGAAEEQTVTFAKPNWIKIESPNSLLVSDGKTAWNLDKKTNTYSESPIDDKWLKKTAGQDALWIWWGFFDKGFAAEISSATKGSARKIKTIAVTEYTVTRKDNRTFSVQFDDATGLPRGSVYAFDDHGQKVEMIVFAKELAVGTGVLAPEAFVFNPPAGAKKAEAVANLAPAYSEIKDILDRGCVDCHGGRDTKKGVNLASYAAIMSAGLVQPGDSESSRMMRVIMSNKMPPGAPLLSENKKKLAAWIDGGAKE